jgi:hypothetical protein
MQRLGDIVEQDLSFIVNEFRDFTRETTIQCGTIKKTLYASLQSAEIDFTSDVSPLNAFSFSLYFIDPKDADFSACLVKNAIIYVDSKPYKIIDCATVRGLVVLSLERKQGR